MIDFPDFLFYFDFKKNNQNIRAMNWDIYERIRNIKEYKNKHNLDVIIPYEDLGDYLAILKENYKLVKKEENKNDE